MLWIICFILILHSLMADDVVILQNDYTCCPSFRSKCTPVMESKKEILTLSDVVRETLANDRRIKILNYDITRQIGVTKQAAAPFDLNIESTVEKSRSTFWDLFEPFNFNPYNTEFDFGAAKRTRFGTEFAAVFSYSQKPTSLFSSTPLGTFDTVRMNIAVSQPLLRGLYWGSDRMTEFSEYLELEAVWYETMHQVSDRVRNVLDRYWAAVSAKTLVEIQEDAVARYEQLVENTQRMVDLERIAASDLYQPVAELNRQRVDLEAAIQAYHTSLQLLNLAMGYVDNRFRVDTNSIHLEKFPTKEQILPSLKNELLPLLVNYSQRRRLDILAAGKRVSRYQALVKGYQNDRYPRFNVFGRTTNPIYSQVQKDAPHRLSEWIVGAEFSVPIENSQATGRVLQNQALMNQQEYIKQELRLEVKAAVINSWYNQLNLAKQLEDAEQAVQNFYESLESEKRKFTLGFSTLFRIIEYENRLTNSQIRLLRVNELFAQNLTNLRYQSGSLVVPSPDKECIAVESVTTVPLAR